MKKKMLAILGAGVLTVTALTGCVKDEPIMFEGNQYSKERVSEIIENRLEDENGIEFEVEIYEESE